MTYIQGGLLSTRSASRRGTGQAAPIRVGCRCHTEGLWGEARGWRFGCGTSHSPPPVPSHYPWHPQHSAQTGSSLVRSPACLPGLPLPEPLFIFSHFSNFSLSQWKQGQGVESEGKRCRKEHPHQCYKEELRGVKDRLLHEVTQYSRFKTI